MSKKLSDFAIKALEILGEVALGTGEFVEVLLSSPYGASMDQMQKQLDEIRNRKERVYNALEEKRKFYDLLYRLKKDGLIKSTGEKKNQKWQSTQLGIEKLEKENDKKKYFIKIQPQILPTDQLFKIVIFDIPEPKRKQRYWLRKMLVHIGFRMLQKSVWAGKNSLPEEFIQALREMKILECVEIFGITKAGSLKKIV